MNLFHKDFWLALGKKYRWQAFATQAVIFLLLGVFLSFAFSAAPTDSSPQTGSNSQGESSGESHQHDSTSEDVKPEWWTCSMHPQIRKRKPGTCPLCQMDLVPVKASSSGMRTLSISPAVKKLMKVETAPVERKYVTATIRMVGKVDFDETEVSHITAWVSGRLDRLFVDYTGVSVKKGTHMVYIYSEELYSIQEELLTALRFEKENPNVGGLDLVEAAREKLRLLGLSKEQIDAIELKQKADDHTTIFSPESGVVIEKLKKEGDRVRTGDRIYTVADLSKVWVQLDAYESDLQWLRYGQIVSFTVEAFPGETFQGRVSFMEPTLNKATRTVKVRVNVDNADARLKPEMFVRAMVKSDVAAGGNVMDADLAGKWISPMHPEIIKDEPGNCDKCGMPLVRAETLGFVPALADSAAKPLVIPASAALITGTRAIVYVEVPGAKEPTYEGREVLLGPRAGDYYLVRNGLFDGENVVTNGNFKIDSALQIQAKPTMMTPEGGGGGGHDHGGDDSTSKSDDDSLPKMEMILPDHFKNGLENLFTASEKVSEKVKTKNLDDLRLAFEEFETQLNQVSAANLDDHPAMLWKEFLMRLGNDSIEGKEAQDFDEAFKVASSLKNNIAKLKESFLLGHENHENHEVKTTKELPVLNVPDEFKQQLSSITQAYFQIQEGFATDDEQMTVEGINTLRTRFSQLDERLLDESAKTVWDSEKKQLTKILQRLADVKDMNSARSELALLSEQLLAIINRFGNTGITIYELHCPMAFDGRGATWLQSTDQPNNPYFAGSFMESCADRVKQISSAKKPAEKGHRHE